MGLNGFCRKHAVIKFETWLYKAGTNGGAGSDYRIAVIEELAGKNLACWCPLDQPCHADVLLKLANGF